MPPVYKKRELPVRGGAYSKEEDDLIGKLYPKYENEPNKWKLIADELKRGHKSVRERYVNHLDKRIDKTELTIEEKSEIDRLQSLPLFQKKWAEIAKQVSRGKERRRTELQIKNYWNSKDRTNSRIKGQSFKRISKIMSIDYILSL